MRRRELLIAAGAATLGLSSASRAQAPYPSRAITWVVGFPPGGGADGVTRMVAAKMSQNMGQTILVENRPGASAIIAAQSVAQGAADGYTLLSAEQGMMIYNTALYAKLPYDPARDFVPVSNMIRAPLVLAVHPSFPSADFKSFVAYVKSQPGKLNYASPGRGLTHHLAAEALKARVGLDIVDVHYKGIAPAMQDVIAGQLPMTVTDMVVALPQLRAGKLRALATFSDKRLAVSPDIPALGELGYDQLDMGPIVGVVMRTGTPREMVARINQEVGRALRDPDVNSKLTGLGLEIVPGSAEEFTAFLQSEATRWLPLIRKLDIKLE